MNDDDTDVVRESDAGASTLPYGYAAYLLIESLLHELIARGTISTEDAIGIVGDAIETERGLADEQGTRPTPDAVGLLRSLSSSLRADLLA